MAKFQPGQHVFFSKLGMDPTRAILKITGVCGENYRCHVVRVIRGPDKILWKTHPEMKLIDDHGSLIMTDRLPHDFAWLQYVKDWRVPQPGETFLKGSEAVHVFNAGGDPGWSRLEAHDTGRQISALYGDDYGMRLILDMTKVTPILKRKRPRLDDVKKAPPHSPVMDWHSIERDYRVPKTGDFYLTGSGNCVGYITKALPADVIGWSDMHGTLPRKNVYVNPGFIKGSKQRRRILNMSLSDVTFNDDIDTRAAIEEGIRNGIPLGHIHDYGVADAAVCEKMWAAASVYANGDWAGVGWEGAMDPALQGSERTIIVTGDTHRNDPARPWDKILDKVRAQGEVEMDTAAVVYDVAKLTTEITAALELRNKAIKQAKADRTEAYTSLIAALAEGNDSQASKVLEKGIHMGPFDVSAYTQLIKQLELLAGETVQASALCHNPLALIHQAEDLGTVTKSLSIHGG